MVLETDRGRKNNVIIAMPNHTFGESLKKHFENEGLNVIGVYVVLDHLIEKLHEIKKDPNFKLDGLVINSSIALKAKDKRLEYLADVIETIRNDFSETSIIFLSDEMQGHPMLAELVSMGIYNIFAKSAQGAETLNIKQLIRCIERPMLYNEVKKFRDFDKGIPWRRFINGGQPITINVDKKREKVQESSTPVESSSVPTINSLEEQISSNENIQTTTETIALVNEKNTGKGSNKTKDMVPEILEEDLEEEEYLWQLPPVKPKVIVRDRIIGKFIIAVAGIDKSVGTTHTSILVANHLASKGYKVKIVEYSGNNEFIYIEKSYEGKNVDIHRSDEFEINGVTFVKSGEEIDMASHVTSEHTHIVLDLGVYESNPYIDEFHRAGKQIIVGSGSEWKQHSLNRFLMSNEDSDQSRWDFAIPLVDKQTISDIKSENEEISFLAIPYHPDPFKVQDDTDDCFNGLFEVSRTKNFKILKIISISFGFFILTFGIAWIFILK